MFLRRKQEVERLVSRLFKKVEVIRKKYHPINPAYQDGIGLTQSSDLKMVTYQKNP